MASLSESLVQQLMSSGALAQISGKLGADEATTSKAVSSAVPLLMTALARNASHGRGAESLFKAVSEDHDGSVLDDIPGYLNNPDIEDGQGILRHTLGGQQAEVENNLSGFTGMNSQQLGQLLAMAAPLVLGMLGKLQKQGALDSSGLSNVLGQEKQATASANPDLMDMLSSVLGSESGGFLHDLGRMAGDLFKRRPSN